MLTNITEEVILKEMFNAANYSELGVYLGDDDHVYKRIDVASVSSKFMVPYGFCKTFDMEEMMQTGANELTMNTEGVHSC